MTASSVSVPYLLSFVPGGVSGATRPGRGEAGWTVATFASGAEALAFMRAHPESTMRSWRRLELRLRLEADLTAGAARANS